MTSEPIDLNAYRVKLPKGWRRMHDIDPLLSELERWREVAKSVATDLEWLTENEFENPMHQRIYVRALRDQLADLLPQGEA